MTNSTYKMYLHSHPKLSNKFYFLQPGLPPQFNANFN